MNTRTFNWIGRSGAYPINQMRCQELKSVGDQPGDELVVKVNAIGGVGNVLDSQHVKYDPTSPLSVTYWCTGTTLNYSCSWIANIPGHAGDSASSGSKVEDEMVYV